MCAAKRTKDEMIAIAYELQNEIVAALGKRPVRITTNREFSILRLAWGPGYEKRDWYDPGKVAMILESFKAKYHIHINEISQEDDSRTAVWLTKAEHDPEKKGAHPGKRGPRKLFR